MTNRVIFIKLQFESFSNDKPILGGKKKVGLQGLGV
jgi:hypothetical protein